MSKIQNIGLDIGRGYVKAYSVHDNVVIANFFNSVIAENNNLELNLSNIDNSMFYNINGKNYLVGKSAVIEGGFIRLQHQTDDKTDYIVEILIASALNKIAKVDKVNIVLGVPHTMFTKNNLNKISDHYKNKKFVIKDNQTGNNRVIEINDITIFKESDAAYFGVIDSIPKLEEKPVGIVNVGYRTTELSYYDQDMRNISAYSKSLEIGNFSAIENYKKDNRLLHIESMDIDNNKKYNEGLTSYRDMIKQKIENEIAIFWKDIRDMEIFLVGGTSLHFKETSYNRISNSQLLTAKGLYVVAKNKFGVTK